MIEYSKFKDLLDAKGVSSYTVSKATHISQSVLSDWKNGKSTPKLDKIQKIADYFGVSTSYFMEEGENANSSGYYLDPETAKAAQEVFDDPNLRILFDAARDSRPEDIRMAADMLKRFKETNLDG